MVSTGTELSRAFCTIVRSVAFDVGSPPPARAATSIWRMRTAKSLPRACVGRTLLVLDRMPLRVTGHSTSLHEELVDAKVSGELAIRN